MRSKNERLEFLTWTRDAKTPHDSNRNCKLPLRFNDFSFLLRIASPIKGRCQGAMLKRAKGSILGFRHPVNAFF